MDVHLLKNTEYEIRYLEDITQPRKNQIQLIRTWKNNRCTFKLVNKGNRSVRIKEVVLFSGKNDLESNTPLYGEGYNMLSQYKGTITQLELIGNYSDSTHYKLPQKEGMITVYNMVQLSPENQLKQLMAFTSCNRFSGEFRFSKERFEIVLDSENLSLEAGQEWELEDFIILEGNNREQLLDLLAEQIQTNHPKLQISEIPTGWCSWYCYGPEITQEDIFQNIKIIEKKVPELKYIQIDDGYQAFMGDWLTSHPSFNGDIQSLCLKIKEKCFEPAIWVAPFIAEPDSLLFQEHPDWFVKDQEGEPLNSATYSFGGWRNGPWYMLDGTHPEARNYLTEVFKTMRDEWGCHYFKLDAIIWGALHGGVHFDPFASRIEAYRRGMQAIIDAVGKDCFILGCNAPMWPSLGLVHGMRVTDDVSRDWDNFTLLVDQGFHRAWQHNRLWINDPDCLVLQNSSTGLVGPDGKWRVEQSRLSEHEFLFHATYMFASGGMVLSGDNISTMDEFGFQILRKCFLPLNQTATFIDEKFTIGKIEKGRFTYFCLFNRDEEERKFEISLSKGNYNIKDFWLENEIFLKPSNKIVHSVSAHSASILCVEQLI